MLETSSEEVSGSVQVYLIKWTAESGQKVSLFLAEGFRLCIQDKDACMYEQ